AGGPRERSPSAACEQADERNKKRENGDDEGDDRERVAPTAERGLELDLRRGRVGRLRPGPVDDASVGVRLANLERVRLRRVGGGEKLEDSVFLGRRVPARPADLLDLRLLAGAGRLHVPCPARRRHERVEREAVGS